MAAQHLTGAASPPKTGEEKLIVHWEKARFIDILSLLLHRRRPVASYHFIEAGDQTAGGLGIAPWLLALDVLILKALAAFQGPVRVIGLVVEFLLNFLSLNGGFLGIIWNVFRCKLVIPLNREAPNFLTINAIIDGRTLPAPGPDKKRLLQLVDVLSGEATDVEAGECAAPFIPWYINRSLLEITILASRLAYENAAHIERVVNTEWKAEMQYNFVGFYNCWNKFVKQDTTQAFVVTDAAKDATAVVVAFRGTEMFNLWDWATDVDLSWLRMGKMGNLHVGFLKALGLQEVDGMNAARAFPRDVPAGETKKFAYYELRSELRKQLKKHPKAQWVVTGHSLGGALAAIFPALLALHGESDILGRLAAVHTYGQPRVGDAAFAEYLRKAVQRPYARVVYRYDLVPRVPFDAPPIAKFRHGGTCVYFDGWYDGRVLDGDVPNRNYFRPRYLLSLYANAVGDLIKAIFLGRKEGSYYRESLFDLIYRALLLLIPLLGPGIASHDGRNYENAVNLGHIAPKQV